MEKIILEDKEREIVIQKLNDIAPIKKFYYVENEIEEGKIFKSKKYQIMAVNKEDVKKYIQEFLEKIGELMGIECHLEIGFVEEVINVNIVSDNSSIIIGKDGKNINALQIVLRQSIKNKTGMNIKVNLDSSEYKYKKQKRFEREIKNIAREVLKSKIDVKLDPMNSYDRRIVHFIISNYEHLETESNGETPNRYVIIKYKED